MQNFIPAQRMVQPQALYMEPNGPQFSPPVVQEDCGLLSSGLKASCASYRDWDRGRHWDLVHRLTETVRSVVGVGGGIHSKAIWSCIAIRRRLRLCSGKTCEQDKSLYKTKCY